MVLHNLPIKADTAAVLPPFSWLLIAGALRRPPRTDQERDASQVLHPDLFSKLDRANNGQDLMCLFCSPQAITQPFHRLLVLQILKRSCTEILSVEPSSACVNRKSR